MFTFSILKSVNSNFRCHPGLNNLSAVVSMYNKNLLPYLFNTTAGVGGDFLDRVQIHVSSQL